MESEGRSESVVLCGPLVDGLGEGQRFTAIPWVRQRFRDLLGIDPYPGTVNVRLGSEDQRAALARLRSSRGIVLPPEPGFCAAACYRATLQGPAGGPGVPGAIVVPDVSGYPKDQVELVAAVNVRRTLGLQTGDEITLHVTI